MVKWSLPMRSLQFFLLTDKGCIRILKQLRCYDFWRVAGLYNPTAEMAGFQILDLVAWNCGALFRKTTWLAPIFVCHKNTGYVRLQYFNKNYQEFSAHCSVLSTPHGLIMSMNYQIIRNIKLRIGCRTSRVVQQSVWGL